MNTLALEYAVACPNQAPPRYECDTALGDDNEDAEKDKPG